METPFFTHRNGSIKSTVKFL